MNLKEIFSQRLREAREMRGMTQFELMKKSDCVSIPHLELGGRLPSAKNIVGIAKALNVTTDYLLGMNKQDDYYSGFTDEQIDTIKALLTHWGKKSGRKENN